MQLVMQNSELRNDDERSAQTWRSENGFITPAPPTLNFYSLT